SFVHTVFPAFCLKVTIVSKIHSRTETFIYFKYNIPSMTTISTCWATFRDIFFPSISHHSISAITCFYVNIYLIDKHTYTTPFYSYGDRKSTRLNSSHVSISYAVVCSATNK